MYYNITSVQKSPINDGVYCYSKMDYRDGDSYLTFDYDPKEYVGTNLILNFFKYLLILVVPWLNIITSVLLILVSFRTKFIHQHTIKSTITADGEEVLRPVYNRSMIDFSYPKKPFVLFHILFFILSCVVTQMIDIKNFF